MNKEKELEKECLCQEENKECTCHKQGDHDKTNKKKDKNKKEIEKLKSDLSILQEENKDLKEKMQYSKAELVNYRKRKEEETTTRLKYANQDLILEIIPVLDNFERAIKLDDNDLSDELSKFLAGFKMMYASLAETLKKFGLEEIDCMQKEFDPNTMQALMTDHDDNFEDDIVLEVLLKGYKLKDRVIRPASVKVNQIEGKEEMKNE